MIQSLAFSIDIVADKANIWKALWDEKAYRHWINVFDEGSYVLADNWNEGDTVHFLGADKNGIYSIIEKHVPGEVMAFKHIGLVVDGAAQPLDDETMKWSGTTEVYKINEGENKNTLKVEIDVMDEHVEFMTKTFPLALEKIKEMSLAF